MYIRDIELMSENNDYLVNMIKNHESQNVEFKLSFRWNHFKDHIDKRITEQVTRAICGFLVSKEGGNVLIGVNDDGEVVGVESDIESYDKKNHLNGRDRMHTDIGEKIRSHIGVKFIQYCHVSFEKITGKYIILIRVDSFSGPVIHMKKDLYVRITNATVKLTDREAYSYLEEHYNIKKSGFDLEFFFFRLIRLFRLAKNIIEKNRENYYPLILISLFFNVYWYIILFIDYSESKVLFPFAFLTLSILTLKFNFDLIKEYNRKEPKIRSKNYVPDISKNVLGIFLSIQVLELFLLLITFIEPISIILTNPIVGVIYLILIGITIVFFFIIKRTIRNDLKFLDSHRQDLYKIDYKIRE